MNQNQTGQPASATVVDIAAARAASASASPLQDIIAARQESQILTAYALSPYLRANELKASVHNGKATLTGKVADSVTRELAEQIALAVSGIHGADADRRARLRGAGRRCDHHFDGEVEDALEPPWRRHQRDCRQRARRGDDLGCRG
jgi:osmotically-inducible protein OsmY